MPGIHIDRLTLHDGGAGMQPADAERLARLVAERLAASVIPGACGRIDSIRLGVTAQEDLDQTANGVVAGLLLELSRSLGGFRELTANTISPLWWSSQPPSHIH